MSEFAKMVCAELVRSRTKFATTDLGYKHGKPHYFYAVILEELEEFWELVRCDSADKDADGKLKMLKELVQIGAMAQRAAEDMELMISEEIGEKCGVVCQGNDQRGIPINSGPCQLEKGHSGGHSSGSHNWGHFT